MLEFFQLALTAVERLHHGQIPHPQERLLHHAGRPGRREHRVHDEEPGTGRRRTSSRFQRWDKVPEDGEGAGEGPVVQDHAEEVDGCGPDGLRGEEVVGLRGDVGADGGGLRGENGGAVGDGVREVLDAESEVGECGREGNGGAAGGAADLRVGVCPTPLASKPRIPQIWRWLFMVDCSGALTSTTTAPSSKRSQS